jgi:NAD-dependent deacetylase
MRPHVVWFGEFPLYLQEIETVLDHTDILVVIGTSGSVMPASLFPQFVNQNGRNPQVIEVNPSPTNDPAFTKVVKGYAVSAVPKLVEDILISHDAVSRQISSSVMVSQV